MDIDLPSSVAEMAPEKMVLIVKKQNNSRHKMQEGIEMWFRMRKHHPS